MPFLMHAPSPNGMVVNEYYAFRATAFAAGDPVFARPATPACVPAGHARTPRDAVRIIRTAHPRFEHLPLTELFLGETESGAGGAAGEQTL